MIIIIVIIIIIIIIIIINPKNSRVLYETLDCINRVESFCSILVFYLLIVAFS